MHGTEPTKGDALPMILNYLFRALITYALLLSAAYGLGYAQPSWVKTTTQALTPPPPAPAGAGAMEAKEKVKTKVVERVKIDTLIKYDTITKYETLPPPSPVFFNYTVHYEILSKKLAMQINFQWDFEKTAQKTILQSSDTTLLSLGKESLRTKGFTYDNHGNKTEAFEKLIEGLDMRINGRKANITYRTGENLLTLDGRFDKFGLLLLNSDFNRRRYFLYFIPIDFLFGSEKYTLFLRIEKQEAK
jgi:hypothetical protein